MSIFARVTTSPDTPPKRDDHDAPPECREPTAAVRGRWVRGPGGASRVQRHVPRGLTVAAGVGSLQVDRGSARSARSWLQE
jgi:hypothetical protein